MSEITKRIGITEIDLTPGECPKAAIRDLDTDEVLGWLAPYGGYCFQVSGDRKGNGDFGSTRNFGIREILESSTPNIGAGNDVWPVTQYEVLKSLALMACDRFALHCRVADNPAPRFEFEHGASSFKRQLSNGRFTLEFEPTFLDVFIYEVIIWRMPVTNEKWTIEH